MDRRTNTTGIGISILILLYKTYNMQFIIFHKYIGNKYEYPVPYYFNRLIQILISVKFTKWMIIKTI